MAGASRWSAGPAGVCESATSTTVDVATVSRPSAHRTVQRSMVMHSFGGSVGRRSLDATLEPPGPSYPRARRWPPYRRGVTTFVPPGEGTRRCSVNRWLTARLPRSNDTAAAPPALLTAALRTPVPRQRGEVTGFQGQAYGAVRLPPK